MSVIPEMGKGFFTLSDRFQMDEKRLPVLTEKQKSIEYIKCKMSLSYFVSNYARLNVNGPLVVGDSEAWKKTHRYHELLNLLQYQEFHTLLGSRQIFKTTSLYYLASWLLLFYPNYTSLFVSLDLKRLSEFIRNVKFIIKNVPDWMQVDDTSKSEKSLSIELINGSRLLTDSVSKDVSSIGRGLSAPTIMIDEPAFFRHFSELWTSIYPTYTKAAANAKAKGLPTTFVLATTPNGKVNEYYELIFKNSISSDDIKREILGKEVQDYDTDDPAKMRELLSREIREYPVEKLFQSGKNGFICHRLHWSLLYDQEWYDKQCAVLNYDMRKIGQELDIKFLGGSTSILDDETLGKMHIQDPIETVKMVHGYNLNIYSEITNKPLIMGVDTALSTLATADYSTIYIMDAVSKEELASLKIRTGVLKIFSAVLKSVVMYINQNLEVNRSNISLGIERNSIGIAIIEDLVYDEFNDYEQYITRTKTGKTDTQLGITTSASSRSKMQNLFLNTANASPEIYHSREIIEEINSLESTRTGKIQATSGQHDDLWMAQNLALYTREILIDSGKVLVEGVNPKNAINPRHQENYLQVTMDSLPTRLQVDSGVTPVMVSDNLTNNIQSSDDDYRTLDDMIIW